MNAAGRKRQFNDTDARMTRWMARHGIAFLRVALGVVFVWFGALKLVPGLSPAEDLVVATVSGLPLAPPDRGIEDDQELNEEICHDHKEADCHTSPHVGRHGEHHGGLVLLQPAFEVRPCAVGVEDAVLLPEIP